MAVREYLFIDKEVQGALVGRVVVYWLAGIAYVALGSVGYNLYLSPNWTISQHFAYLLETYWAWIPSAVLILPMVIYDILRLSNKFAGPIFRLRDHLKQLVTDPDSKGIQFRGDDYWRDLAKPINQLQHRVLVLQNEVADLECQLAQARMLIPGLKSIPATATGQGAIPVEVKTRQPVPQLDKEQDETRQHKTAPSDVQDDDVYGTPNSDTSERTQSGTALLDEATV